MMGAAVPWQMPEWMKAYRCAFVVQGDESKWVEYVEEMHNDRTPVFSNAPRVLIACEMHGMVGALTRLHAEKII